MKIITLNIPDNTYKHRHYCIELNDVFVKHQNPILHKGIGSNWVEAFHNGKKLNIDAKDYEKAGRYDLLYSDETQVNLSFDESINDDLFLLYDTAGLNYAHFFFDFFSRCLYFDEMLKINPNLKLGIPEDYYQTEGNSNFIKQWLDLYYKDKNINIVVLKKNTQYKISTLILPSVLYGFPEPHGDDYVISKIIETADRIPPINVKTNGCYISRQDTIKRGWYHKRDLVNELELIDKIKSELNYDIIELMDYDLIGKIQIFKSYKNIIQQSSASNINILFSGKNNTNVVITNPKLENWLMYKINQFSLKSKAPIVSLNGGGEIVEELGDEWADKGNATWRLVDINGLIEVLKQIDQNNL
jgi:hypothetical protein